MVVVESVMYIYTHILKVRVNSFGGFIVVILL